MILWKIVVMMLREGGENGIGVGWVSCLRMWWVGWWRVVGGGDLE